MGSLGGKKESSSNKKTEIKPTQFYTPFGDVKSSLKSVTLDASKTPQSINQSIATAGEKENAIIQGLSTNTSPNQLFNNPFTEALRKQLTGDFNVQAQDQRDQMMRQLAARRSLDNSAGLYALARQEEAANRTRGSIEAQAVLGGADVFTQNLQNELAILQNLQRSRLANMEQIMAPIKLAAGYQSVLNPLTTAQANIDLMDKQQPAKKSGLFGSLGGLFGMAG